MRTTVLLKSPGNHNAKGYTLAEVIISAAIAGVSIAGIVWGYLLVGKRTDWSTCSAAAQLMVAQRIEQTRAAKWDPFGYPPVDELVPANFPVVTNNTLDIPSIGAEVVVATNTTTITLVQTNPPLKMIRVECTWSLVGRGPFTNLALTYRAPDQ
jgi:Tfp pilus assembly protein PilE